MLRDPKVSLTVASGGGAAGFGGAFVAPKPPPPLGFFRGAFDLVLVASMPALGDKACVRQEAGPRAACVRQQAGPLCTWEPGRLTFHRLLLRTSSAPLLVACIVGCWRCRLRLSVNVSETTIIKLFGGGYPDTSVRGRGCGCESVPGLGMDGMRGGAKRADPRVAPPSCLGTYENTWSNVSIQYKNIHTTQISAQLSPDMPQPAMDQFLAAAFGVQTNLLDQRYLREPQGCRRGACSDILCMFQGMYVPCTPPDLGGMYV